MRWGPYTTKYSKRIPPHGLSPRRISDSKQKFAWSSTFVVGGGKVISPSFPYEERASLVDNGFGLLDAKLNLCVAGFVGSSYGVASWEEEANNKGHDGRCIKRKKKTLKGRDDTIELMVRKDVILD